MPPWPKKIPLGLAWIRNFPATQNCLLCHIDESGRILRLRTPTLKGETESITSHISHHPRSYCFSGAARYDWQHSVPEGSQRRWSFTFRSLKQPSIAPAKSKSVTCWKSCGRETKSLWGILRQLALEPCRVNSRSIMISMKFRRPYRTNL